MTTVILRKGRPLALHRRQPHWPESLLCSHLAGHSSVASLLCSRHHFLWLTRLVLSSSVHAVIVVVPRANASRSQPGRQTCFSNVSICSEEHDIEPSAVPPGRMHRHRCRHRCSLAFAFSIGRLIDSDHVSREPAVTL